MPAMLVCDIPGCGKTIQAVPRMGLLAAPTDTEWWVQPSPKAPAGYWTACCQEHLIIATKGG